MSAVCNSDFTNKRAVITGGAGGIGRCIAEAFLAAGADIAVIDLDAAGGDRLAAAYPGRVLFFAGDVADETVLEDFSQQVVDRFGQVDYLINNACLTRGGVLSGCPAEDFNYVLRVGVTATYLLALLLRDHFAAGGSIVNIASTRAVMSQPDTESYSAAKGGIRALTHALAVSLAGRVRVNCISPGWIDNAGVITDAADIRQHPAGRIGRPEDIAAAALFLCGGQAGFINGEEITIDGGMTKQMIYHGDYGWEFTVDS